MLEIRELSVRYGTTTALDRVSLHVEPGEAVALLGANGAGKTSLLRAVTRLTQFSGSVFFDGVSVDGLSSEALSRRGLIHVPEGRHIFPDLTVFENLQMGLIPRGRRTSGWSIDEVLDLFPPLSPLCRRSGFALSGGEQQMLAVGRALVAAPKLLLLDEPSLGLSPLIAAIVFDALKAIQTTTTILVVEQNSTLALGLVDRAYVLSTGRMVLDRKASDIGDRSALLASYLGQKDVAIST